MNAIAANLQFSVPIQAHAETWAKQLVQRFHKIFEGHVYRPSNWQGWELHLAVDIFDHRTITAYARSRATRSLTDEIRVASCCSPDDLESVTNSFLEEIRIDRAACPEGLKQLSYLPKIVIPATLVEIMRADLNDVAFRELGRARQILDDLTLSMDSPPAYCGEQHRSNDR